MPATHDIHEGVCLPFGGACDNRQSAAWSFLIRLPSLFPSISTRKPAVRPGSHGSCRACVRSSPRSSCLGPLRHQICNVSLWWTDEHAERSGGCQARVLPSEIGPASPRANPGCRRQESPSRKDAATRRGRQLDAPSCGEGRAAVTRSAAFLPILAGTPFRRCFLTAGLRSGDGRCIGSRIATCTN